MKDSIIIYRDWWEAIKKLPTAEMQLDALFAVLDYGFDGIETKDEIISAITALMRSGLDRDKNKWEDIKEKRREAGRKGALKTNEKRWNNDSRQKSAKSANAEQNQQMPTNVDNATPENETGKKYEEQFEEFRNLYPGTKRGFNIEFSNFKKKYPKDWKTILPKLVPAVKRLIAYHEAVNEANSKGANIFLPNYAYLQTWINNARWEEEFSQLPTTDKNETKQHEEDDYSITDFNAL